jgi:hypothetical protein
MLERILKQLNRVPVQVILAFIAGTVASLPFWY